MVPDDGTKVVTEVSTQMDSKAGNNVGTKIDTGYVSNTVCGANTGSESNTIGGTYSGYDTMMAMGVDTNLVRGTNSKDMDYNCEGRSVGHYTVYSGSEDSSYAGQSVVCSGEEDSNCGCQSVVCSGKEVSYCGGCHIEGETVVDTAGGNHTKNIKDTFERCIWLLSYP